MLDTLDFLDALGRGDPAAVSVDLFSTAVGELDAAPREKHALLIRDGRALGDALVGREPMMVQIWAPRPGRERPDPVPQRQDQPDSPGRRKVPATEGAPIVR